MSQAEVHRIVAVGTAHAHLAHPGSFYSWGGDGLLSLYMNTRDEARFRTLYNQPVGGGANSGPGLYISTRLHDSASYCPDVGGVLLQVDVPETTPYISVSNHTIMNMLRQGVPAITAQMLTRNGADMPPILSNHAGTWHCLKATRGVGMRLFDGRGSQIAHIQHVVDTLRNELRYAALAVLLVQLRPDRRAQIH